MEETKGDKRLKALLTGAAIGAVGMYLSDKKNREKVKSKFNELKEQGQTKFDELKQKGSEAVDNLKDKINEEKEMIADDMEEMKDERGLSKKQPKSKS